MLFGGRIDMQLCRKLEGGLTMDNRILELKSEARGKVVDWAEAVVALAQSREVYGWELEDRAAALLAELEPIVSEYAGPPSRILRALKYGNQAGCGAGADSVAGSRGVGDG